MAPRVIYTVGHSTRTLAELGAILRTHAIDELVDVRSIRRSRSLERRSIFALIFFRHT